MKTLLEFDYKKAVQAINYLAKKEGGKIDKLKLIKLIYFADRYHIRKYGRPIINDAYIAMPLGAVGSSVKDIAGFSDFLADEERSYSEKFIVKEKGYLIKSIADTDLDVFSKSDIEAIDFAYNKFGGYKASKLVDICHKYPEWEKFKKALESKETTRENMNYLDFFGNPAEKEDDFLTTSEVLDAAKELFEEHYEVAKYWN